MTTLTIWDASGEPPRESGEVYRWNGYSDAGTVHSLLHYIETHEESLRRKYLAWIHDLGETCIDGRRLIDHLAFEDGLSYWWLTRLAEKSPYRTPITDAIRLLAVGEIVVERRPQSLRLVSGNPVLRETLSALCRNLGIRYELQSVATTSAPRWDGQRVLRLLPHPIRAVGALLQHVVSRWSFRRADCNQWFGGDQSVFFCSYFAGTAPQAADEGRFASRYWDGVTELLAKLGLSANWLHHYFPDNTVTARTALDWVARFNRRRSNEGFHTFVDTFLGPRVVARVVTRWLRLMHLSWRLRTIEHAFRPAGTQISLWPLMKSQWFASMRGAAAIDSLLFTELLDAAVRTLPHQRKGLYLCENQPWERALTHSWRKYGHGQLIAAAAHVTVRFWDLRYFVDPRTVASASAHAMPRPDVMALNGKAAIAACLGGNYPKEAIVEAEALRYRHLGDRTGAAASHRSNGIVRVLLLGDYLPSSTIGMLKLLEASVPRLAGRVAFGIKLHPNFPTAALQQTSLRLDVETDSVSALAGRYDVAFSSNMTSAALDIYLAGLPVIVKLEDAELNMSPLRGQPAVRFVSTVDEVVDVLLAPPSRGPSRSRDEFFFIDNELPRWERLLSYAPAT